MSRGVGFALVAALAAGFVAWAVWAGFAIATPAVSGRLNTFQIESDSQVHFTLTIERTDPGSKAVCRVIAQADNFERVGEMSVEVPPGTASRVEVEQRMKTFRRATSVSLDGCTTG